MSCLIQSSLQNLSKFISLPNLIEKLRIKSVKNKRFNFIGINEDKLLIFIDFIFSKKYYFYLGFVYNFAIKASVDL